MPTTIRPVVSRSNPFYISKHRYYELKHFCLQYPEWKREYSQLLQEATPRDSICKVQKTTQHSDKTADLAVQMASIKRSMDLIEDTVKEVGNGITKYLFACITEGIGYSKLCARGVPCSKEYFYERYRAFFWLLDKRKE